MGHPQGDMARLTQPTQLFGSDLPDFRHPPVVEVVCSIQFKPIEPLDGARLGLLWPRFRDRYPRAEQHPPILPSVEEFGPPSAQQIRLRFTPGLLSARVWFLDETGSRLIQVQHDRFIVNWRKEPGQEEYPRYPVLRQRLEDEFARFKEFLQSEGLPEPEPNQVELTYVNHIVAGSRPTERHPLSRFIRLWAGEPPNAGYMRDADNVEFACSYLMTGQEGSPLGRLHIKLESQFLLADNTPLYGLSLVGRGAPNPSDLGGALRLMDDQHAWIVQSFADITTPEMQANWERTR